jgi:uncharacterized membrane protein YfcA
VTPAATIGLALLGVFVGALGTLIGAGGGFLLLPALALLDPHEPAAILTGISLSVVAANALSGSFAYARMGRIDWRAGLVFAAAGLPGAIGGAWATQWLDRRAFDPLLGAVLIVGGGFVLLRPADTRAIAPGAATRTLVDRDGVAYAYAPRIGLGALLSVGVGFLSSLLGIGGGILHVPLMVLALGFPTHVATATSHFVLAILATAGVLVHAGAGSLTPGLPRIVPLAAGVLVGAQLGARLSTRIRGRWILVALALALASVGVRLLVWR